MPVFKLPPPTTRSPLLLALVVALLFPLSSAAQAPGPHDHDHSHDHDHDDGQAHDADDDHDSDAPFARFDALPGLSAPGEAEDQLPSLDESADEAPDEPVELRFRLDDAVTYDTHHVVDLDIDGAHHFTPRHRSSLQVTYQPIDDEQRQATRTFGSALNPDQGGQLILATVERARVAIDAPQALIDDARPYQIYDDATFSFRLDDRGQVGDIRVHRSTNPLVMSTVSEIAQYLSQSMPLLPDEPIEPGHTWEDTFTLQEEDEEHHRRQEVDMIYRFDAWVPCGDTTCAAITIHSDLDAQGRFQRGRLDTQTEASGQLETMLFLDPDSGQVVASRSNTHANGHTFTDHDREEEIVRTTEFDFHLHIDSIATRRAD